MIAVLSEETRHRGHRGEKAQGEAGRAQRMYLQARKLQDGRQPPEAGRQAWDGGSLGINSVRPPPPIWDSQLPELGERASLVHLCYSSPR